MSTSRAREEKRRLQEDRAAEKKFLQKVRAHTKSLTESLVLQIESGGERPTVILPERGTELCEVVAKRLEKIFSRRGYRPNYDTDPSVLHNKWTDLGWEAYFESDPRKSPTFWL